MSDDDMARLRTRLTRLSGPARTRPLLELSQLLANRYWRAGPGSTAGLPDLDAAIVALREACGYLDPGDTVRIQAVAQLGTLVGGKVVAYGGADEDRDNGIALLREALGSAALPPAPRDLCRVILGQLYLGRGMRPLRTPDSALTAIRTGTPLPGGDDVDAAIACFRQVLDGPPVTAEIGHVTQALLTGAEAMKKMTNGIGTPGNADFGSMMAAMQTMQEMQDEARRRSTPGGTAPPMPSIVDAETIVQGDPLDYPAAVVPGPEPIVVPMVPRPRREPAPVDLDGLRRTLRSKIVRGADLHVALAARLLPDAPSPSAAAVDDLVALAMSIAHNGGDTPTDRLLVAVALYLRSRIDDGGGWAEDDDPRLAGQSLLASGGALPGEPAGVVSVTLTLAGLLDRRYPAGRVLESLAERFAPVAKALREIGCAALAYPRPGGMTLLNAATGRFGSVEHGSRLPHRIMVAGNRSLPPGDVVVSYVASAAQVLELAGRAAAPLTDAAVFIADPRGDHEAPAADLTALRRAFYSGSVVLGRTGEKTDGSGTPTEVLARLDASLLYLGCGVTAAGALELAGPAELDAATIAAGVRADRGRGGLAVLPPVAAGFVTLADALLAAGFTGVVGWARPVPWRVAAPALFALHSKLLDDGLDPATAVRQVRRWMRDPGRRPVPGLPADHAETLAGGELIDPAHWTALVLRGN